MLQQIRYFFTKLVNILTSEQQTILTVNDILTDIANRGNNNRKANRHRLHGCQRRSLSQTRKNKNIHSLQERNNIILLTHPDDMTRSRNLLLKTFANDQQDRVSVFSMDLLECLIQSRQILFPRNPSTKTYNALALRNTQPALCRTL